MKFVLLHPAPSARWGWELRSRATDALYARSNQFFVDRADAVASIEAVQRNVPTAVAYDEAGLMLVPRG
jgi:hypothetical protein